MSELWKYTGISIPDLYDVRVGNYANYPLSNKPQLFYNIAPAESPLYTLRDRLRSASDGIARDTRKAILEGQTDGSANDRVLNIERGLAGVRYDSKFFRDLGTYFNMSLDSLRKTYGRTDAFLFALPIWFPDCILSGKNLNSALMLFSDRHKQAIKQSIGEGYFTQGMWHKNHTNPFRFSKYVSPTLENISEEDRIKGVVESLKQIGIPIPEIQLERKGNSTIPGRIVLEKCSPEVITVELNASGTYPAQYETAILVEEMVEAVLFSQIPQNKLDHVAKETLSHLAVATVLSPEVTTSVFGIPKDEAEAISNTYLLYLARNFLVNTNWVYFESELWRDTIFWGQVEKKAFFGKWFYAREAILGIDSGTTKDLGLLLPHLFYNPYVNFSRVAYLWADTAAALHHFNSDPSRVNILGEQFTSYKETLDKPTDLYEKINETDIISWLAYASEQTRKYIISPEGTS